MPKESGLGVTTFSLDDSGGTLRIIINDVTNFAINTTAPFQDVTGIDKSATERFHLVADANVPFSGVFNKDASTGIHTVMKNFMTPATGRTLTITHSAQTLSMEVLSDGYNLARGADGTLISSASYQLMSGIVPAWS